MPTRKRDLAIVVADSDTLQFLNGLLSKRFEAFNIREPEVDWSAAGCDVTRVSTRDSGCYRDGRALLADSRESHQHGLLILDAEWDGTPGAEVIDKRLSAAVRTDWGQNAAVIVIDPELEAWAFTGSEKLPSHLGWSTKDKGDFNEWWAKGELLKGKPEDPKAVLDEAGRDGRRRRDPKWWCELGALPINFSSCTDASFLRLKKALQSWFPRRHR